MLESVHFASTWFTVMGHPQYLQTGYSLCGKKWQCDSQSLLIITASHRVKSLLYQALSTGQYMAWRLLLIQSFQIFCLFSKQNSRQTKYKVGVWKFYGCTKCNKQWHNFSMCIEGTTVSVTTTYAVSNMLEQVQRASDSKQSSLWPYWDSNSLVSAKDTQQPLILTTHSTLQTLHHYNCILELLSIITVYLIKSFLVIC